MLKHRGACTNCGTHVDLYIAEKCPSCGSGQFKAVVPTSGDLSTAEADVIEAAESLDYALLVGQTITRQHPHAQRLAQACRELKLTRSGVVCK